MEIEQYYRQELALFRERAKGDPHLAQLLAGHSADNDAGYVLESFAFLTASLRTYLEDPYTELSEALLQRLMPEMLKPFPCFTTLAFTASNRVADTPVTIERGAGCASQRVVTHRTRRKLPVRHEHQEDKGESCYFSTCRPTVLLPFTLERTELDNSPVRAEITLHFRTGQPLTLQQLHLELLRFCLSHDPETGRLLYLWFRFHFCGGALRVNGEVIPLKRIFFKSVGFEREDRLLPWSPHVGMGHHILLEYFLFPEAFLYIDLMNLPPLPEAVECREFSLCFHFKNPLPPEVMIDQQTIQLFCTPAINHFSCLSEMINSPGSAGTLPLMPKKSGDRQTEIYSIDEVVSWTGEFSRENSRRYLPFEEADNRFVANESERPVYYLVHEQPELFADHVDYALSFVYADKQPAPVDDDHIRIGLTCTNLELPLQLDVGEINKPDKGMPPLITLRNISRPTAPLPPLRDGTSLWGMISSLSLNFLTMLSKEALVETLKPYNLRALHDPHLAREFEQRLQGICKFETDVWDWIFEGVPVRGMESDLYLSADNGAFTSESDLYLFGTVLSHFFAVYASINSYHRLMVHDMDTGGRYQWRVRKGQRKLL